MGISCLSWTASWKLHSIFRTVVLAVRDSGPVGWLDVPDLRVLQKVTDSLEELPKFYEGSTGKFFVHQDVFRCYKGHFGFLRGHPKSQIIEETVPCVCVFGPYSCEENVQSRSWER